MTTLLILILKTSSILTQFLAKVNNNNLADKTVNDSNIIKSLKI